jgi:hypothetical protein
MLCSQDYERSELPAFGITLHSTCIPPDACSTDQTAWQSHFRSCGCQLSVSHSRTQRTTTSEKRLKSLHTIISRTKSVSWLFWYLSEFPCGGSASFFYSYSATYTPRAHEAPLLGSRIHQTHRSPLAIIEMASLNLNTCHAQIVEAAAFVSRQFA